jgi:hypothetical protein
MPTLTEVALEIAVSYLGVHEQGGQNRGPDVDRFLANVRLPPGEAWCAAFLWTVFDEAAKRLTLVNPLPRTGSTLKLWSLTEPICRDSNPTVGAIYVLKHSESTGHVGIVESLDGLGNVGTEISGNTFNDHGGREGNCVARHSGQPEKTHGGVLLGYLVMDRAAQPPPGVA